MFAILGAAVYRRRRLVLAAAAAFVAVALTWGVGVFGALTDGGFQDPGSDSARATARAEQDLGRQGADVVVLYRASDGRTVEDPAYRAAVEAHLAGLPADRVDAVTTFWSTGGAPGFVSTDRQATYAALSLVGDDEDSRGASYEAIAEDLADAPPGLDVQRGGDVAVGVDIGTQVGEDIARAEGLSTPILLVLLLIIFGGLAAASLPLAIGGLAILGAFTLLRVLTLVTDVSVFSINIITMLGLGLAIDYALFVVSRFREELGQSASVEEALVRTMSTAGRTVAFSGITVAIALGSLLLFPQVFLRSMGFGGMAAVLVAMVAALTVLPALLGVLGHRVNALRLRLPGRRPAGRHRAALARPDEHGAWYRVAQAVMRRPLLFVVVIVPLLLAIGSPFLRAEFGGVDYRALPDGTESREVAEALVTDFPGGGREPVEVVVSFADAATGPAPAALAPYVERLAALPGVTGAEVAATGGGTSVVAVAHQGDPQSPAARALVEAVRAVPAPEGAEVLVGGASAELVDLFTSLADTLPLMAVFVVVVTLVLLFFAFGSVVLPVKAVVMNVLSLTASFGALVWIFQDGNLSGFLGFDSTGAVEATQPILMLAIAFGLSMDYEVFLLSRVREQWDRTGDNATAVAVGLQRTGRIITSAAVLLCVVIGAFSTSGIIFIKMIGVGLVIAILIDATVVRALLVPATMRLMGRANWWAPRPLARLYERYGFREGDDVAASGSDAVRPGAGPTPGPAALAGAPSGSAAPAGNPADRVGAGV
jgi:trehalose monomycolate/heme transporter